LQRGAPNNAPESWRFMLVFFRGFNWRAFATAAVFVALAGFQYLFLIR